MYSLKNNGFQVFLAAKDVEESLQRHETGRMVAWCYENKSKLRKIKSTLELEIRVQEFVELVRIGKRGEAVKHARKYLACESGKCLEFNLSKLFVIFLKLSSFRHICVITK